MFVIRINCILNLEGSLLCVSLFIVIVDFLVAPCFESPVFEL